uniref:SF3 helicase domain-containing protein n=1 Tax=viral metagenome TaxID=1070528 RepID=A0A6C0BNG2_9ZZZZ
MLQVPEDDPVLDGEFQAELASVFNLDDEPDEESGNEPEIDLDEMGPWDAFCQIFISNHLTHRTTEVLSNEDLQSLLDAVHEKAEGLLDNQLETSCAFFQIDTENEFNRATVEQQLCKYMFALATMSQALVHRELLGDQTVEAQQVKSRMIHTVRMVKYGNHFLTSELRRNVLQNGERGCHGQDINLFEFNTVDLKELSAFQRVVLEVLKEFHQHEFKRYRSLCYQQIVVFHVVDADHNHTYFRQSEFPEDDPSYTVKGRYPTSAWEPAGDKCELIDMVYRFCQKGTHFNRWVDLTKCSASSVAQYLAHCHDPEFPEFRRHRLARSFRNGMLHFTEREQPLWYSFFQFRRIPSDLVACKFYNQEFDNTIFNHYHWANIFTPSVQAIFDYQNFSPKVCSQLYTQIGRVLYELGQLDNWEVVLFFMGVARSGKSTLGKTALKFFQREDVGILASSIEAGFGLDALVDKLLYVCLEVTKNWNLPRADFQSIISGEDVSIRGKHKVARTVKWNVPGLLFGNELGPWIDSSGSIVRRLLVIEMSRRVQQVDTELDAKLEAELPTLIYKLQQAYVSYVGKCGVAGIWEKVPSYFKKVQTKIAISTNPIKDFIHNSPRIIRGPDLKMPLFRFRSYLTEFLTAKKMNISYTIEQLLDVFQQEDLKIVKDEGDWEGQKFKGRFVKGVTLRETAAQVEEQEVNAGLDEINAGKDNFKEEQEEEAKERGTEAICFIVRQIATRLIKPRLGRFRRAQRCKINLPAPHQVVQDAKKVLRRGPRVEEEKDARPPKRQKLTELARDLPIVVNLASIREQDCEIRPDDICL